MVVRSSKDIAMTRPVTVDPRYHDAVMFNLDDVLTDTDGVLFESAVNLVRKLLGVGVATAAYALRPGGPQLLKAAGVDDLFGVCVDGVGAAALVEATRRLGVRPQRSVVIDDAGAGVAAARDGGFALAIGVDRGGHADRLLRCGADVVVTDLDDVAVRTGDRRISELPDAVESYGQIVGVWVPENRCCFSITTEPCPPSLPTPAPPPSSTERIRRWKAWRRNAPSPY
jgi:hypothetical protein